MSRDFVVLDQLNKNFGGVTVVGDLTLHVAKGEILSLLGPSGSGKTTTLRLLAGFETPDRGRIVVDGKEITRLPPTARGFGMVFQHYALFPHLTVGENVAFGLRSGPWQRSRIRARVAEMLELVDLEGFEGRQVSEISGGQQQRVALARALAPEPRVLLLDEPLSNLDPSLRERTRHQLKRVIQRVGITTLFVTHEQEEAFDLGDRVAILNAGRLEQVERPMNLYQRPTSRFVAEFVGRSSTLPGRIVRKRGWRYRVQIDLNNRKRPIVWTGAAAEEISVGAAVDLLLRPESLTFVGDPGHPGSLAGRVLSRHYTGPVAYYRVALLKGGEVEVMAAADATEPGQVVYVALARRGLLPRVFPRG